MLASLRQLLRYRALIQSLVARELKARYRGSVLGFFWSFVNPLLLLLIYTFVFTVVMPGARAPRHRAVRALPVLRHPAVDVVLLVAARSRRTSLIAGGNLIRKVLFPAEVLPIVTVLAGPRALLPRPADPRGVPRLLSACRCMPTDLLWLPVIVLVQLRADARAGAAASRR